MTDFTDAIRAINEGESRYRRDVLGQSLLVPIPEIEPPMPSKLELRVALLEETLAEVIESVWDHLGTTRCKELLARLAQRRITLQDRLAAEEGTTIRRLPHRSESK